MFNKKNKKIECNVSSCSHNDCDCNCCNLDNIKISCNGNKDKACKKETICDSFEEKKENK